MNLLEQLKVKMALSNSRIILSHSIYKLFFKQQTTQEQNEGEAKKYGEDKNKSQYHYWWRERTQIEGVDFKPTKIEDPAMLEKLRAQEGQTSVNSNQQASGSTQAKPQSAWNRAGTWEDKTYFIFAMSIIIQTLKKYQLQKILESSLVGQAIRVNENSEGKSLLIEKIQVNEGSEANVIMVRGKVKIGFEVSISLDFSVKQLKNCNLFVDGAKGSAHLQEITDDEDDCIDFKVQGESQISQILKNSRKEIVAFIKSSLIKMTSNQ